MAFEDFTTYTEVDEEGTITVAAQQISFLPVDLDMDSYVYDDKGVGHFGDYDHYIDFEESDAHVPIHGSLLCIWGVTNTVDDFEAWATGQYGMAVWDGNTSKINFYFRDKGNANSDSWMNGLANTRYYLRYERIGVGGTCKIYGDAAHTDLKDTLNIVVQNTTFRYVYAGGSRDLAVSNKNFYGYTYNLDLREVETHESSDTAKSSDALTFKAEVPIADTAKAADAVSFKPKIPLADTAKASDSISFKYGYSHIVGDIAKASDALTFGAEISLDDVAKASDSFSSDTPPAVYPCSTFRLYGTSTNIRFPKPEWANPSNGVNKNVELFNFKSGDLDTVDRGIDTQPLIIGGTVFIYNGAADWGDYAATTIWLDSIKTAMNSGEIFEINELKDCLNGIYVISDFTFNTIKGAPDNFTWSLNLERVRDI